MVDALAEALLRFVVVVSLVASVALREVLPVQPRVGEPLAAAAERPLLCDHTGVVHLAPVVPRLVAFALVLAYGPLARVVLAHERLLQVARSVWVAAVRWVVLVRALVAPLEDLRWLSRLEPCRCCELVVQLLVLVVAPRLWHRLVHLVARQVASASLPLLRVVVLRFHRLAPHPLVRFVQR